VDCCIAVYFLFFGHLTIWDHEHNTMIYQQEKRS